MTWTCAFWLEKGRVWWDVTNKEKTHENTVNYGVL